MINIVTLHEPSLRELWLKFTSDKDLLNYTTGTILREFDSMCDFVYIAMVGINSPYQIDNSMLSQGINNLNEYHLRVSESRGYIYSVSEIYSSHNPVVSSTLNMDIFMGELGIFGYDQNSMMIKNLLRAYLGEVINMFGLSRITSSQFIGRVLYQFVISENVVGMVHTTD